MVVWNLLRQDCCQPYDDRIYVVSASIIIVILNEVKDLLNIGALYDEILHFVQNDIAFTVVCVSPGCIALETMDFIVGAFN